jgi:hypothetical protein
MEPILTHSFQEPSGHKRRLPGELFLSPNIGALNLSTDIFSEKILHNHYSWAGKSATPVTATFECRSARKLSS